MYPNVLVVVRQVPTNCKCKYTHKATHWNNGNYRYPTDIRNITCVHGHLGDIIRFELLTGEEYKL